MSTLYPPDPWLDQYAETHSVAVRAMLHERAERRGFPVPQTYDPLRVLNGHLTIDCQAALHDDCAAWSHAYTSWGQLRCWCLCHHATGQVALDYREAHGELWTDQPARVTMQRRAVARGLLREPQLHLVDGAAGAVEEE